MRVDSDESFDIFVISVQLRFYSHFFFSRLYFRLLRETVDGVITNKAIYYKQQDVSVVGTRCLSPDEE